VSLNEARYKMNPKLKKTFLFVSMLLYAIITIHFVFNSIKLEGEGTGNLLLIFVLIVVFSFLPALIGLGIKNRKIKTLQYFFLFIFCFTILLIITTSVSYFIFANKHQVHVDVKSFAKCLENYNTKKTGDIFDPELFLSSFNRNDSAKGMIILDINKQGKVRIRDFNYYFLLNKHKSKCRPAEKPEDIKYIIIVEPQVDEYFGKYSDNTDAYRESVQILVFKVGKDFAQQVSESYAKGSNPKTSKTYGSGDEKGNDVGYSSIDNEITVIFENNTDVLK